MDGPTRRQLAAALRLAPEDILDASWLVNGPGGDADFEVRTLIPGDAMVEDPVTGSFNAGAAQWLMASGRAPEEYVAAQGTVLGRAGRIHVKAGGGETWIGGKSSTCIRGSVIL